MGVQSTFKALSDATRRDILNLLKTGSMTAGEIGEKFSMTGATISHHLSVLKSAGLISDDKRGKYIFYELNMSMIDEMMSWVVNLKGGSSDEKNQQNESSNVGTGNCAAYTCGGDVSQAARSSSDELGA